jgi:hypothetical protein
MFFEPLAGKRDVSATDSWTNMDLAKQIKKLLDAEYAHAQNVTLVMDKLTSHTGASLYEVFGSGEVERLVDII